MAYTNIRRLARRLYKKGYAAPISAAIYYAKRGQRARMGQFSRNRSYGKQTRSGNGVTNQYDAKTVYRRRRMPYRRRKRWGRFVKKVMAVTEKEIGTRSVIANNTLQIGGVSTLQAVGVISLYGWRGTTSTSAVGTADVRGITQNDTDINAVNEKWKFTSAVLDCTFNNTGAADLEVDVYEVIKTGRTTTTAGDLVSEYGNALANTITPPGTMTTPTISIRGWTPFNCSIASSKGLKIIKKRKYFLKQDETFTYQVRDPRTYWVTGSDLEVGSEYARRGMTKMLLIISKPVVGSGADVHELVAGCTRSYHYKVMENNEHMDGLLP